MAATIRVSVSRRVAAAHLEPICSLALSLDTRTSRAVSHEAELKYKIQYVHVFVCSAYTKNTLSYLLFLYWVVVGSSTICCVTSRCDEEDNEQKKKNKKRLSSLSLQDDLPTVLQSHHTSHVYTIQFISVFKLDKEKIKNVGCDLNKNFYHPRCKMQDGRVTADNWSVKFIVLIFRFVKCEYFLPSFLLCDIKLNIKRFADFVLTFYGQVINNQLTDYENDH